MSETKAPDPTGKAPDRRKLIAVLHADMVGYSRLIGLDDVGTLGRLRALRQNLIDPAIEEHGGRIVSTGGDSLLIVFDSVDGAVRCAVKVQQEVPTLDRNQPPDRAMRFRVGINVGDVIPDGADIHGDVVNVAARLQAECPPGGVCVSRAVREHLRGRLDLAFEEFGALNLKNINRPVEAFVLKLDAATTTAKSIEQSLVRDADDALPLPGKPSIAVLAFTNMSGDPEQEYFSDGIADDIISELARSRSLFVVARNSSFTYKGHPVDLKQVGRELGVRYVVEGSVRRSGNRIRVTTQLIDAETGNHIWAGRYDREVNEIFAVQDDITAAVAGAVLPAVAEIEQQRALRRPPENLGAWEAYQRGLWYLSRPNTANFALAQQFFQQAIKADPIFASPCYRLAHLFVIETAMYRRRSVEETIFLAGPLAQRATELDPDDADAQAVAAIVSAWGGEWAGALARAEQAVQMNPNSVSAHRALGFCLMNFERSADAQNEFLTCLRINSRDPMNWLIRLQLGASYYYGREYGQAAKTLAEASRISPNDPEVHFSLAAALGQLGRMDEAQAALARATSIVSSPVPSIVPRRRTEDHEHLLDGLRKAGWHG